METNNFKIYKDFLEKIINIDVNNDNFNYTIIAFVKYFISLINSFEKLVIENDFIGLTYILRGQYEILLQFCYLVEYSTFEKDNINKCHQRALSCLYFNTLQEYELAKSSEDENLYNPIKKQLEDPIFNDIKIEYDNKNKNNKYLNWYNLYSNISTLNKLEEHLDFKNQKNQAYNLFSKICHGNLIISFHKYSSSYIKEWLGLSNSFMGVFCGNLIYFATKNKLDIQPFLSFMISNIEDDSIRNHF